MKLILRQSSNGHYEVISNSRRLHSRRDRPLGWIDKGIPEDGFLFSPASVTFKAHELKQIASFMDDLNTFSPVSNTRPAKIRRRALNDENA